MSFLRAVHVSTRVPLARGGVIQSIRYQSTAAASEYNFIITSIPRPGVGQSACGLPLLRGWMGLTGGTTSYVEPAQGAERAQHAADEGAQFRVAGF
jgi:hypothetical protein